MHCFDLITRSDELNKITSLAMSNTQIVMMENIEDAYFNTNNARRTIDSDIDYINLYKDNLEKLISTNSSYSIKDYYADARKGLLYVNIECSFKTIKGDYKTLNKKLLNIIDVIEDDEKMV